MKKKYMIPATEIVKVKTQTHLLVGSSEDPWADGKKNDFNDADNKEEDWGSMWE